MGGGVENYLSQGYRDLECTTWKGSALQFHKNSQQINVDKNENLNEELGAESWMMDQTKITTISENKYNGSTSPSLLWVHDISSNTFLKSYFEHIHYLHSFLVELFLTSLNP